jgi:hypothetical protein
MGFVNHHSELELDLREFVSIPTTLTVLMGVEKSAFK